MLIFPSHQHIKMTRLRFISFQFSVKFPRSHVSESSSSSGSRCGLRFVGVQKWSRWSDQFYVYVDIVVDVEKNHLFQGCVGVTTVLNRGGNHHLYPEEKTLISSYLVLMIVIIFIWKCYRLPMSCSKTLNNSRSRCSRPFCVCDWGGGVDFVCDSALREDLSRPLFYYVPKSQAVSTSLRSDTDACFYSTL